MNKTTAQQVYDFSFDNHLSFGRKEQEIFSHLDWVSLIRQCNVAREERRNQ